MGAFQMIQGDCLEIMPGMAADSVHCCVTSPPYWGLRDYGLAPVVWDGDVACKHEWGALQVPHHPGQVEQTKWKDAEAAGKGQNANSGAFCSRCYAWRGSLGLEPTPELFVQHIVQVFREVRRVLRPDGTLWLNMGDSYCSQGGSHDGRDDNQPGVGASRVWRNGSGRADGIVDERGQRNRNGNCVPGLKPKDLCGIPWRVAFALQADGWWLRSDIIWAKPNPMPESVTDRPTKAHEYLFLLAKSPDYFWDAEAVKEKGVEFRQPGRNSRAYQSRDPAHNPARKDRSPLPLASGRNIRSVWTLATEPTKDAHFATYPQKLVVPCVKAGTSERGCCPKCGKPWERMVEKKSFITRPTTGRETQKHKQHPENGCGIADRGGHVACDSKTLGWRPGCACPEAPAVPCTCLDPFCGSGTTGVVALKLGRRFVGIELNKDYVRMSERRIADAARRQRSKLW